MFHSARLTLTAWYLLIIMVISVCFSVVIYRGATQEITRALRMQQYRLQHPDTTVQLSPSDPGHVYIVQGEPPAPFDPAVLEEERQRILLAIIEVNIIILVVAGAAGYFLAGRTLQPIKVMLDEQNRFVSDASHELRTPLTSMKTALEVNLRDNNLTVKEAREVLESNLEDVNALQTLSDGLLQLAHVQNHTPDTSFTPVSVDAVLTKAWKKVQNLAKVKKITLQKDETDLFVLGDERSLTDVLSILFDNAIKYSSERSEIRVIVEQIKDSIRISVQDHGIGIEAEDLPHIFDRFYRADAARSKQQVQGYGLGLSIAKRIIELHHGIITASSTPEKGTTFSIDLPIKK